MTGVDPEGSPANRLADYLTRGGWRPRPTGQIGTMWVHPDHVDIGVPHFRSDPRAWVGALRRVAIADGIDVETLVAAIHPFDNGPLRLRTGRRNRRALYRMICGEPTDIDPFVGSVDSALVAEAIVAAVALVAGLTRHGTCTDR